MTDSELPEGRRPAGPLPPDVADAAESLSHISVTNGAPRARMVDVGAKPSTRRSALARAIIRFPSGIMGPIVAGRGPKGPIEEVARVAGVMAAKGTGSMIPMCHPLGLDVVDVTFREAGPDALEVLCRASCTGPTGVEMEAMVGASVAALTVYDMTKAASKGISIESVELLEKTGGKSGVWRREGAGT